MATALSNVIWPVPPENGTYTFSSTQDFGPRVIDGTEGYHYGLDFGRTAGTPIVAIAGGIVDTKDVDHSNSGNHIIIDHGTYRSGYKHMLAGSHSHLQVGSPIAQGDPVGNVGSTGYSFGAHLHLDIYSSGQRVDPYAFLTSGGLPPTATATIGGPSVALAIARILRSGVGEFYLFASPKQVSISRELSMLSPTDRAFEDGVMRSVASASGYSTGYTPPLLDDSPNGGWYLRNQVGFKVAGMPLNFPLSPTNPYVAP